MRNAKRRMAKATVFQLNGDLAGGWIKPVFRAPHLVASEPTKSMRRAEANALANAWTGRYLKVLWEQASFLADWRTLRLEREVWRSCDLLTMGRLSAGARRKYYANLFEPTSLANKVSIWMPNQLIPG